MATLTRARNARVAVTAVFVIQGLLFASWAAHIPGVKHALRLDDAALGTGLLGAPAGSVLGLLVAGWLLPRVGSATMIRLLLIGYCLSGMLVGRASDLPELFLALAGWGACQGALGVAMNTQAVDVERLAARPIMASLHGGWSVGGLVGAGIGATAVGLGVGLTRQLLVIGPLTLLVGLLGSRWLLPDHPPEPAPAGHVHGHRSRRARVRAALPTLLLLGAVNCIGMVGQGSAADWSAVYVHETVGAGAAVAAVPFAVYSLAIVVVRLGGPALLRRTPTRLLLPTLAVLAILGLAGALLVPSVVTATLGFTTLALGVGLVVPTCITLAGRVPGLPTARAVALVSGIGWVGFMLGPPVIGHLASWAGLRLALALIPLLLCAGALATARAAPFRAGGLTAHARTAAHPGANLPPGQRPQ